MESENWKGEASRRGGRLLASLISILTLLALALAGCAIPRSSAVVNAALAQVGPAPRLTGQPGPGGGGMDASHNADPVQVQGSIQRLSGSGLQGTWQVSGLAVQVTASTSVDQRAAPAAAGAEVEVHGWLQSDGSLQADWIRVLSPARPMAGAGPSPLRIIMPTQGLAAAGVLGGSEQGSASVTGAGIVPSRIPDTGIHADSPGFIGWLGLNLHYAWLDESFVHSPQRSGPALGWAAAAVGGQASASVASAAGAAAAAVAAPSSLVQPVAQAQPAAQPQPAVFHPPAPAAQPPAPPPVQAPPPIVVIGPPIVVPPVVAPPAPVPPAVAPPPPQPAPPPVVAPPAPQPPPGHSGGGNVGGSGKDHKGKGSNDGGGSGQGGGGKGKGQK